MAEGRVEDVERLLERVAETFAGNIERQMVEDVSLPERPDGFEIRA